MLPNGSLAIADVYSPLEQSCRTEEAGGCDSQEPDSPTFHGHLQPPVSIDDHFFFLCSLSRVHAIFMGCVRKVPSRLRFAVQLFLFASVMVQFFLFVMLHSLCLPTPTASPVTSGFAMQLTEILNSTSTPLELMRLHTDMSLPQFCSALDPDILLGLPLKLCQVFYEDSISCEFASEQALLRLPASAREQAYGLVDMGGEVALSMRMEPTFLNSTILKLLHRLPGIATSMLSRQLIVAMVKGPFHSEARMRDARNSTLWRLQFSQDPHSSNESTHDLRGDTTQKQTMESTWPLFGNWVDSGSDDTVFGSSALAYVSCQGEAPRSIEPLRRVAELLHRRTEWWLFKVVWMLSIVIMTCLVGMASSFTIRAALLGLFRIWIAFTGDKSRALDISMTSRLELLESFVLVFAPVFFVWGVSIVIPSNVADDISHILFCQAISELCASCTLRTKESRYIFPRVMLLLYFANIYYVLFHPFGFIQHSHSLLHSFQAFLLVTLWSHFEVAVTLPATCSDQLTVEVRLRPAAKGGQQSPLSAQMQQFLLEQGLLLLGDDQSHESAVVMSAIIMRALQTAKPLPAPTSHEGTLTIEDEEVLGELELLAAGGGVTSQVLLDHAHTGNSRCLALARHLVARLQKPSSMRRNEVLRWLLQRHENEALWVLNAVANARPHLLAEAAPD